MGAWIKLVAQDGHQLSGYRADPPRLSRGGVVVIQEVFGVNQHIRDVCDRFARAGYQVLAPALFDRVETGVELGYTATDLQRARALRASLDWDQALADVAVAVQQLAHAQPVAVVGFCYGGTLAWLAAEQLSIAAAVAYYGTFIHGFRNRTPQCPVLLHFGQLDEAIAPEHVEDICRASQALPVTVASYPGARHGFNCDLRDSYHPPSAMLAWKRTLTFLAQHLERQTDDSVPGSLQT